MSKKTDEPSELWRKTCDSHVKLGTGHRDSYPQGRTSERAGRKQRAIDQMYYFDSSAPLVPLPDRKSTRCDKMLAFLIERCEMMYGLINEKGMSRLHGEQDSKYGARPARASRLSPLTTAVKLTSSRRVSVTMLLHFKSVFH